MYKTVNYDGEIRASASKKTAKANIKLWLSNKPTFKINNLKINEYFNNSICKLVIFNVFDILKYSNFSIDAKVYGGGLTSQAYALRLAIIKCILSLNKELKKVFRDHGYVTTDCRSVERKKYGLAKARKSFQYSKR
ncbi:MAG: 30S ribosomal protein S9 [Candidatus Hodgkinia cicadicola]